MQVLGKNELKDRHFDAKHMFYFSAAGHERLPSCYNIVLLCLFIFVISTRKHDFKAEITKPADINSCLATHDLSSIECVFDQL